jgi:hypothetical protein
VSIAGEDPSEDNPALVVCCQVLNRLSFSQPVRDRFIADAVAEGQGKDGGKDGGRDRGGDDLVTAALKALMGVVGADEGMGRVAACSFLWNAASDAAFGPYLLPLVPALLPILAEVVRRDDKTYARLKALGIICNIIRNGDSAFKAHLACPELGIVPSVTALLAAREECRPEELQTACNIIDVLCVAEPVAAYLTAPALDLLPALMRLMSSGSPDTVMHVCSIFWNLSVRNGEELLRHTIDLNLVGGLAAVVNTGNKNGQYKALGALCNLAVLPQARRAVGSRALGLLPVLARLLPCAQEEKTWELLLKLLSFISLDAVVVEDMVSADLGLVGTLVTLIDNWDPSRAFPRTLPTILWNLSCVPSFSAVARDFCQALPLSKLVDWIEAGPADMLQASVYIVTNSISGRLLCFPALPRETGFHRVLRSLVDIFESDRAGLGECAAGGLWHIAESPREEVAAALLQEGAHTAVLGFLRRAGPDRSQWPRPKLGSKAMSFLTNLASHSVAVAPLKQLCTVDVVLPVLLLSSNGCECLKAMFIVAFLVGGEEDRESVSLLHARADTVPTLIQVTYCRSGCRLYVCCSMLCLL